MMIRFQRNSKGMFRFILSILFILAIPTILSSLLSCRVTMEGEPYHQGPGPRPDRFPRIEGLWLLDANRHYGKLEFYRTGSSWAGRVWFDKHSQWEELTDIFLDPHTGQFQFYCPRFNEQYSGTLSGNRIWGTFSSAGIGKGPWEARRP